MAHYNYLHIDKNTINEELLLYVILFVSVCLMVLFWKYGKHISSSHNINSKSNNNQLTQHILHDNSNQNVFEIEESIFKETYIIFKLSAQIGVAMIFEVYLKTISVIFVGHLPNSSQILSATATAWSFTNMTAVCASYGICSALWTLIPQVVGSNEINLIPLYVQRALFLCFIVELPLSIILFNGGNILYFIGVTGNGENDVPLYMITNYCRALIPYPYLLVMLSVLQRVAQNLEYNFELLIIQGITFCLSIVLNYIFIFVLHFGYIGPAFAYNFNYTFSIIIVSYFLIKKGHHAIFKPVPFSQLLTKDGLWNYFHLAWPGAIQITLTWIIRDILVIISGYIVNPTICVSVTSVMKQLNRIKLIHNGIANASAIRIGKYIGANSILYAKRCIKIQAFFGIILMTSVSVIYIIFKKQLANIFTNNIQVIDMTSKLIYVALLSLIFRGIYRNITSICTVIGYQKSCAYITFISQYLIAFPIQLYLLFNSKFYYKNNLEMGICVIWLGSGFGYCLADICIIVMLLYYIDWNKVVEDGRNRMECEKSNRSLTSEIIRDDKLSDSCFRL